MADGVLDGGGSPLEKAKPDASLTDFDRRVFESMRKVLWIPDDFKEYMTQYQAINQSPISLNQVIGYSRQTQASRARLATTHQTLTTATRTVINFNTEDFDYGGMWDSASGSRLTVQLAGKYVVGTSLVFDFSGTGGRLVEIFKNGAADAIASASTAVVATLSADVVVTTLLDLAVGDYLQVKGYQNSGGNLDVLAIERTNFWAARVGP